MRKLIGRNSFFIIILINYLVFYTVIDAQTSYVIQKSKTVLETDGIQGSFNGKLCSDGRILEEIEQVYNTNTKLWENSKRRTYDYSGIPKISNTNLQDDDILVVEYVDTWDYTNFTLGNWTPGKKIEFEYDDGGFLIRQSDFVYDINLSGYLQTGLKIYENDVVGNNTSWTQSLYIDGSFQFYKKFHARVGVINVPFTNEGITETWTDGAWQETNKTVWVYNDNCLTSETMYWKSGDDWIPSGQAKLEYAYGCFPDMFDYCIPSQLHRTNPSEYHWMLYNSNTNEFEDYLIEETAENDFLFVGQARYYPLRTITYDSNHNPIAMQRMDYREIRHELKVSTKFPLDITDYRLSEYTVSYWDNNDWVNNNRTLFTYDGEELNIDVNKKYETDFRLNQNYPNPFNPFTTITFELPQESNVSIKIYNSLGNEIRTIVDEFKPAGQYQDNWDGTDNSGKKVCGGTYFCQLKARDFHETRKMVLLK